MAYPELLSFIEQETAQGFGVADIKEQLKRGGWQDIDIEEGFAEFAARPLAAQEPASPEPTIVTQPATPAGKKSTLKPNKSLKYFLWIGVAVGVVITLVLAAPFVLGLIFRDLGPVNDADLQLPKISIEDDQNAYAAVVEIGRLGAIYNSATTIPDERATTGKKIFAVYTEAASKVSYQNPLLANPDMVTTKTPLPPLDALKNTSASVNAIALAAASSGSSTQALELASMGVSIGTKIESSQSSQLEQMVAMRIKQESLRTLLAIATSSKQSSKDLQGMATWLSTHTSDGSGLARVHKLDYMTFKKEFLKMDIKNLKEFGLSSSAGPIINFFNATGYLYQPNRTIAKLAEINRAKVGLSSGTCGAISENSVKIDAIKPSYETLSFAQLIKPNGIGNMLVAVVAVSGNRVKSKQCEEEVLRGAVELVLALKAYEQDHKTLPTALTELAPVYIPNVPSDPYAATSSAYRYDSIRRTVYSVGPTHTDKGGNVPENPTYSF